MHVAKPVDMSCTASSVMLAMKHTQAADAHVAGVRGLSSLFPQEDISPILDIAPAHVLSESGESAEDRPQSEAISRKA